MRFHLSAASSLYVPMHLAAFDINWTRTSRLNFPPEQKNGVLKSTNIHGKSTNTWPLLKCRLRCQAVTFEKELPPAAVLQRALPSATIRSEKLPGLLSFLPVSVHSLSLSSPYSWPIWREMTVNSMPPVKKSNPTHRFGCVYNGSFLTACSAAAGL